MSHILRNQFTGGEVSPEILLRTDLEVYNASLKLCDNYLIKAQGGLLSRPGLEYLHTFPSSDVPGRLLPFVFNNDESYVLAFSTTTFTVFRDGAVVQDGMGDDLIVPLPYVLTDAQVTGLDYAQSADVMTVTVPGGQPITVSRFALNDFRTAIETFTPNAIPPSFLASVLGDPFDGFAVEDYTLKSYTINPNGSGGYDYTEVYEYVKTRAQFYNADLTQEISEGVRFNLFGVQPPPNDPPAHLLGLQELASAPVLFSPPGFIYTEAELVDTFTHSDTTFNGTTSDPSRQASPTHTEFWQITSAFSSINTTGAGGGANNKTYRYVVTAVYLTGEESAPSDPVFIICPSLTTTFGVHLDWFHTDIGLVDYFRVYKSSTGLSGAFGWIGDAENSQFIDFNIAPVVSDSPPERVIKPDKPSCVTYYQQRQVFGDQESAPLTFIASKIALPFLFRQSRPIQPDDAFSVTAATPTFNEIRYLVPLNSLLILTSGSELRSTEGDSEAFTASTTGVRRLSEEGCAKVKPTLAGATLLYVQASKKRLRSLAVSPEGGYLGADLTILSRHLFENTPIKEVSFATEPYGILWCVAEDGTVLTLTYLEAQKVSAWQRNTLGGVAGKYVKARSVSAIPEDNEDSVYMLMERETDTGSTNTLERIKDANGVYGLDMWHTETAMSPQTTFNGFDHLAGETVTVVADDYNAGDLTVDEDGVLTLPQDATVVTAGYGYTCAAELPPIVSRDIERSKPKGVNEIVAYVNNTRGLFAGAAKDNGDPATMWEAYPTSVGTAYDPTVPYTGALKVDVRGPWSVDGVVRIEHREPFRAEILAIETDVDV